MTDFIDEYGVLSLNALRSSADEDREQVESDETSNWDWMGSLPSVLPQVTFTPEPFTRKTSSNARTPMQRILGKLGRR